MRNPPLRSALIAAIVVGLAGCAASLRPLKVGETPVGSEFEPLRSRIPAPVTLSVQASESMPSFGGKFAYPLKHYVETAFRAAAEAAFAEVAPAGGYGYTLEVQTFSSQLRAPLSSFGANLGKAGFQAQLNAVLRGPDGKVIENKNFFAASESDFRPPDAPACLWDANRKAAREFLDGVRNAVWLKRALSAAVPAGGGGGAIDIQAIAESAARKAAQIQSEAKPEKPRIVSDVDRPSYSSKEDATKFALVVGIEKYANIPDAEFAERDAAAVRQHLLGLGYPERNILFLSGSQAVRSGIEKYVESWLPKNVDEGSQVLFYFSGHGAPATQSGEAYLMPWDADPKFLDNTAYPVKRLYEKLNALPAKRVLVAMDACFSGAGGRSVLPKGARPLVTKVDAGGDRVGKLVVLAAANGDEITGSAPEQGHGLFTYYLLKGLNGEAGERGGKVTAQALHDYLSRHVRDAARRENRDQTPQLLRGPGGDAAMAVKEAR